jgi:3-hydroxymyristoyl/3-hydroxydecanoyl-(acyl carrier protein) dehydratase
MGEKHQTTFVIAADHPSLPGHFPGTPVVPGVVVLDHVLRACQLWQGREIEVRALKQVKFHSPLLPEQRANVALEIEGNTLNFRVTRDDKPIAQGSFTLAHAASAQAASVQATSS